MHRENNCDDKSRSRSRSKSSKRYIQHNQVQNCIEVKHQKEGNDQKIDNKEFLLENKKNSIRVINLIKSKEEYKFFDQIQGINLEPNNQFQIQFENQEQGESKFLSISLPYQEIRINQKMILNKQPSQLITINDSSQEEDENVQSIQFQGSSHLHNQQFDNNRKRLLRNCILWQKLRIQRPLIKRTSQYLKQIKQKKQSFECIDLTNDDNIQSFFGLNHPMLQSSMNYHKKILFELVEPYEYQCGNFMISLGIHSHYTAIVTLPILSQTKSIYYLFMMFKFDSKNIYCMVPEDDQTTLLVSSNIQSLYYYCNSNNQQKKYNNTTSLESTLKYKFPYIYPPLIRKFIVSYKKNDSQILYHINYDSHATQLAIEDYYWDNPGHLITGTSHPILKMLLLKSQNNQIPQFYDKFISGPLYEGQFSLKACLQQNGNLIVVERRFLSPFSYGFHNIKIEINRTTNLIVMKQNGKNYEIQSKSIQLFWNEVLQKYLQLYHSKQLYNYFVDMINQDRKILEKYQKWNQLYQYMSKSNQLKSNKSNDNTIILNNKKFFCYSIEKIKNGNNIKYQ
ncbi:unnamed protein product [Paramecium pentaurelia]|uniref:Uncharacterized protein n=1 Tax=Paramecium pentaurelia TaxID=43138 RepID=A0A8S1ST41_9CILI|nr:unnamed protein product [Paramecium pentaurelia]